MLMTFSSFWKNKRLVQTITLSLPYNFQLQRGLPALLEIQANRGNSVDYQWGNVLTTQDLWECMKAIGFFSLSLPDYIKERARTNIARATHQTRSMRGHEALLDPDGHHRCSRRVLLVYSAFSLSLLVGPCVTLFPLILEGNIKIMWQPAGTIHLRFNVSFFYITSDHLSLL